MDSMSLRARGTALILAVLCLAGPGCRMGPPKGAALEAEGAAEMDAPAVLGAYAGVLAPDLEPRTPGIRAAEAHPVEALAGAGAALALFLVLLAAGMPLAS